jgi:tetratricopeptide (TPR) repeat protein
MKRIFLSIFVILTAIVSSISAQSAATQQTFEKGIGLANEGKFETALVDFKKSLTLAGIEDADADYRAKIHFNIGVCLYRLKQSAKAVSEFEEAIKLAKGDYEKSFYALGMAQAELKRRSVVRSGICLSGKQRLRFRQTSLSKIGRIKIGRIVNRTQQSRRDSGDWRRHRFGNEGI